MALQTQSYGQFSQSVQRQIIARRIPSNGTIEVTRRCPLECAHCYNNLRVGDADARRGELTLDEHRRIIDEITKAGCLWLLLTGGEVLARKDFLDIYTHAKRNGLLVTVFTNGVMVTEGIADYLAEWRPFAIEVTLYGRTRETYERLTGVEGSFDRCLRGIALLRERRMPLKLKTVAVSINQHEIGDMRRFAEEELGVPFKFDAMMNPRIDCSQSPLAVRLTPEEAVALDIEDPRRFGEWKRLAEISRDLYSSRDLYHCGAGVNSFAINPEGKMSMCVLSHADTFDLRRGSFLDGWNGFLASVRSRTVTRPSKCTSCRIRSLCSTCAATGELENKDPEAPVEFFCHVAHLRAQAVGHPAAPHGECAYCEGGAGYESVVRSGQALRALAGEGASSTMLPMRPGSLQMAAEPAGNGCGSGGCGSCSSEL